jgi:hypothetical protein
MPCRCCCAGKPSKGFEHPEEDKINDKLKDARDLIIAEGNRRGDDLHLWKKSWVEAFEHHLNGCP